MRLMTLATWAFSNGETMSKPEDWNLQASDAFFRIWGMTRVEFDRRDHAKQWQEFAEREGIKPDPRNYKGANWSEVG